MRCRISKPDFDAWEHIMTTLASILLAFAIGALVAVKLCVWAGLRLVALVVRWCERAL